MTDTKDTEITVYSVSNPGWAMKMVFSDTQIQDILDNISVEIGEMSFGDTLEFVITKKFMEQDEFDALEEFTG